MCGDSNRPTIGGTIAVLFPRENSSNSLEASLSTSPDSIASTSSMSSYSLFFQDEAHSRKTKAIFQIDDAQTYHTLRGCRQVNMRIEKYGDLSANKPSTAPLHQFQLDFTRDAPMSQSNVEFELPERLDLGVSEKGVVGRQLTMSETDGTILGIGIVGYN
ncbi:hypothetical protein N7520_010146 [Penicillium odoratum]|uniref:uncharacterized protein n=1 Tax=Penicillium odoratum TaxID=1167516 RepID=UPI002546DDF1|nr:uncharacterized protein N7520_010146 [Penicillium odoratum]KAJ5753229.1 hypothetical protein N7520_010146 [Penicillium odoratum]